MQASDIMTHPVVTVAPDTPLADVAQLMLARRISGIPVVEGDVVVGMVSEGDLLGHPETGTERRRRHWLHLLGGGEAEAAEYVRTHGMTAGEVMTADVVSVTETTPIEQLAAVLESRGIKRVPVLRDGRLVGIVSRADLLVAAERAAVVRHIEDHLKDWVEPDPLYRPNWPSPGRP